MERSAALRRLRTLLGPQFAYEIRYNAPTMKQRAAAKEAERGLVQERQRLSQALEARRHELIAADATYQKLLGEYKTANKAVERNNVHLYLHKITVGTVSKIGGFGGIFHVTAQGDSWEEVIRLVISGRAKK